MKSRAQTQPAVIPENANRDLRLALMTINRNFMLLDKKIEQLWEEIERQREDSDTE